MRLLPDRYGASLLISHRGMGAGCGHGARVADPNSHGVERPGHRLLNCDRCLGPAREEPLGPGRGKRCLRPLNAPGEFDSIRCVTVRLRPGFRFFGPCHGRVPGRRVAGWMRKLCGFRTDTNAFGRMRLCQSTHAKRTKVGHFRLNDRGEGPGPGGVSPAPGLCEALARECEERTPTSVKVTDGLCLPCVCRVSNSFPSSLARATKLDRDSSGVVTGDLGLISSPRLDRGRSLQLLIRVLKPSELWPPFRANCPGHEPRRTTVALWQSGRFRSQHAKNLIPDLYRPNCQRDTASGEASSRGGTGPTAMEHSFWDATERREGRTDPAGNALHWNGCRQGSFCLLKGLEGCEGAKIAPGIET